jgi:hypothetical protein
MGGGGDALGAGPLPGAGVCGVGHDAACMLTVHAGDLVLLGVMVPFLNLRISPTWWEGEQVCVEHVRYSAVHAWVNVGARYVQAVCGERYNAPGERRHRCRVAWRSWQPQEEGNLNAVYTDEVEVGRQRRGKK